MNNLEKQSFYSFLGLYIISSFFFLGLVGYWYYTAQKNALQNEMYYRLQHITDMKAGDIIMAHMEGSSLKESLIPDNIHLALIDTHDRVVKGRLVEAFLPKEAGYFHFGGYDIFVSDAPRKHLNIKYVVAQSNTLHNELIRLQYSVLTVMVLAAFLLVIIAWVLSKLFMKPIRQRVEQVERFINDVTHELNTPITSLFMSTNQALKQKSYTEKTLKNISISTRQLYDIYSSLTYLNFSQSHEISEEIDISEVLQKSITYYEPLCESKGIKLDMDLETYMFTIPPPQLKLLFGNLISNAIKYSPANTTLTIRLKEGMVTIEDEGIGVAEEMQKEVFKKYKRGTRYGGGFGVGLSIVKSICDDYGIEMTLRSKVNEGTKIILSFF